MSYFFESYINGLEETLKKINEILEFKGIDFCFIGAVIFPKYNYSRMTDDINILVSSKDKEKFYSLQGIYYSPAFVGAKKKFQWNEPRTNLDVMFGGEISGDGINGLKYLEPKEVTKLTDGLPILSLEKLIEYKLSSGIYGNRYKDLGDVQELIRANNLILDFGNEFREDLRDKYRELWHLEKERKDKVIRDEEII